MNYMFTVAEQRSYYQSKLQQADNELERLLRKYEGLDNVRLRVQKHGKGYQYFLVKRRAEKEESAAEKKKRRRGSYIRKRQLKTAHVLAQRDYLLSVQENCRQWLAYCDVVSGLTVPASLSELHLKNSGRYGLISPIILSDSEFLKSWSEKPYQGKSFKPDTPFQVTERGEKVRSKSEKIIADFLNAHQIPYKYECPLALTHSGSGKVILYPDFTLMDIRTRKELYLEHFGLLDKDDYTQSAVWKLSVFAANGIFPGQRLLFFWEGGGTPLNLSCLEQLLKIHGIG